jgi:hypothetical protein
MFLEKAKKEYLEVQSNVHRQIGDAGLIGLINYYFSDTSSWFAVFRQRVSMALLKGGFPALAHLEDTQFLIFLVLSHFYDASPGVLTSDRHKA